VRELRTVLSRRPFVLPFLLVFGWLLLMRGMLLLHSGVWPNPGWMLLADAVGALVMTLLLSLVRAPWLRVPLVVLAGVAFYAAAEHIGVHGTIFRIAHAVKLGDPVFLGSSVATPWLLLLPLYCLLGYLLHHLHLRIECPPPPRPFWWLAGAVGCVTIYGLAVPSLTYPANNVIVSTIAQVPSTAVGLRGPPTREEIEPIDADIESLFFHNQVVGGRVTDPPNILVVMIEGLSAAYLPKVAQYHGLSPVVTLPELERDLERRGFRIYRNVLSMQRQTDRGSYPPLCGAYPRLGTINSEMADVATGQADPVCVAEVLGRHGYQTGYLQAAPLEYMNKERFMPKAGFQHVDGAGYFGPPDEEEGWGPGDDVFFSGAVDWFRELDAGGAPWFAVTLNSGTHHPFPESTPGDTEPKEEYAESEATAHDGTRETRAKPDRQAAFTEMARELAGFFDGLAAEGILDNTLLIVTSDEAGGFLRGEEGPRMLDGNFGALAVRPPGGRGLEDLAGRDALVATLDIALTSLDAAGVATSSADARTMIGRSLLLREPSGNRGLLLGDAYAGYTVFLLETGELMACGDTLIRCTIWRFSPQRLYGTLTEDESALPFLSYEARRQLADRTAVIDEPTD
jgi:hypothetical protein